MISRTVTCDVCGRTTALVQKAITEDTVNTISDLIGLFRMIGH